MHTNKINMTGTDRKKNKEQKLILKAKTKRERTITSSSERV